jgi:hypothetical protein
LTIAARFSPATASYILRVNARRRRRAKHRRRERRQEALYVAALAQLGDIYDDSAVYEGMDNEDEDDDYGLFFITFEEPSP